MTIAFSALSGLFPAASAVALLVGGVKRSRARRLARSPDRSGPYVPPAHLTAPVSARPSPAASRVAAEPRAADRPDGQTGSDPHAHFSTTTGGASAAEVRAALWSWVAFFVVGGLIFGGADHFLR